MADRNTLNGGEASAAAANKTITLPSGKVATLRKGKGIDLMRAQRAAAGNLDETAVVFALIASSRGSTVR
jgi:hypothetical protein